MGSAAAIRHAAPEPSMPTAINTAILLIERLIIPLTPEIYAEILT
jgi:hypothetical protein